MDISNYYEILGISRTANAEEIRTAYRDKAREYHPDVAGEDSRYMFQLVNEAYEVLSDEERREAYDSKYGRVSTKTQEEREAQATDGTRVEIKQNTNRLHQMHQQMMQEQPQHSQTKQTTADEEIPGHRKRDVKQPEREQQWGKKISGSTKIASSPETSGHFTNTEMRGKRIFRFTISALECITGTHRQVAINIDGEPTMVSVYIPAGIEAEKTVALIVLPNSAEQIVPDTIDGIISITADDHLEIDGINVLLKLPLTIREAMLGTKIQIPTAKSSVMVTIPPIVHNTKPLRIKGHGIEHADTGDRGDLYVLPFIVPPDRMSESLEQALRACDAHYSGNVRAHLPQSLKK